MKFSYEPYAPIYGRGPRYLVRADGREIGLVFRLGNLPSMQRWIGQDKGNGAETIPCDTRKAASLALLAMVSA